MKNRTFIILCLEGAILSFNVAATAALVPSIASSFGLPQFYIGNIIWLYMLPYGLAALFYGPLTRTFNAKYIELICLGLFSFSNIMAALAKTTATLFIARIFMGLFGASVIPLALILLSHNIESHRRGRYVGIFFAGTFIASLLGLFLSGIIPWRLIYLLPGICGIILWIFLAVYFPSFKEKKENFRLDYLSILVSKRVFNLFLYIFCISMLYHAIQQWLAVYFSTQYKFNQFLISMLITVSSLSGIFGEAFGGFLSDKIGRVKTVNLGIILMCIAVFLLPYPKSGLFFLTMLMAAWGLGWTFNHASLSTLLTDLPREYLYEAMSLNSAVRFISGGLGACLGGFLMQRNFSVSFFSLGFCMMLLFFFSRDLIRSQ